MLQILDTVNTKGQNICEQIYTKYDMGTKEQIFLQQ